MKFTLFIVACICMIQMLQLAKAAEEIKDKGKF